MKKHSHFYPALICRREAELCAIVARLPGRKLYALHLAPYAEWVIVENGDFYAAPDPTSITLVGHVVSKLLRRVTKLRGHFLLFMTADIDWRVIGKRHRFGVSHVWGNDDIFEAYFMERVRYVADLRRSGGSASLVVGLNVDA